MTLRRASFILPCPRLDDFPTHLTGGRAAELLAGWTALWHPALIDALSDVPAWRSSDDLPDPSEFEGELVVLPESSRLRMSADWCERFSATSPKNPPPVNAVASRDETIASVLQAVDIDGGKVRREYVGDLLALGHAHLQVELLTRAMHYSSVLDTDQFASATTAAARAAIAGNEHDMREELSRAFDLLADARNHVYSVDFFVVDITLLAPTTLGGDLRAKLATGSPTSLLAHGELLDQMASEHPETLAELRRAVEAGTASVIGGTYHRDISSFASPEKWLEEINLAQAAAERHLQHSYEVFALFRSAFSPLMPAILVGGGFTGALHASFDGGRLPRTEQVKTWWGAAQGGAIAALTARPLDASRPETWLKLAGKIGDTIAHDHVATIVLASWPGKSLDYYKDVQRASRYGPVLGKLVTLEEYFRVSREPDEWTKFHTREYSARPGTELGLNPISAEVDAYRRDIMQTHCRLGAGLASVVGASSRTNRETDATSPLVANPWNFACTKLAGANPLDSAPPQIDSGATGSAGAPNEADPIVAIQTTSARPCCIPEVPGWGFATFAAAAPAASIPLAEDRVLRNERLEVTISEATGAIQSIRAYRDRSTRVSQRLAFHRGRIASTQDSTMAADHIAVTRNDALIGEIESRGRLLDAADELLANFTQRVRVARGVPAVFVDIELDPQRLPDGDVWRSYYASRLAWTDDAIAVRRGGQWLSHETARERIESPGWVEIVDIAGTISCFGFGLPFHRRASPTWLDTLLIVAGEERRHFQFALAIDEAYPLRTGLGLFTCGHAPTMTVPTEPTISRGWFLHVGAKNIIATHLEPLSTKIVGGLSEADHAPPSNTASASETPPTSDSVSSGIRVRLLETEGRDTHTTLAAFRPFTEARTSDFRGNSTGVLSVVDGRIEFDIAAHSWIQIEAEW
jgi:alpha-mannosidase